MDFETAPEEPFSLFDDWFLEAKRKEKYDPTAFSLATIDEASCPQARIVLLKSVGEDGFVFYTNLDSKKGQQLKHHHKAAICFHWQECKRQVRAAGLVELVSKSKADDYFSSRPRESQLAAWASAQSQPLASRSVLEASFMKQKERFKNRSVPRPAFWGGLRLIPFMVEFWAHSPYRLHHRLVYDRTAQNMQWKKGFLFP